MATRKAVVIGAGLGGLSAALELSRRGYDVIVLERHATPGGKASTRSWNGWRWDEGPSIVVMTWVYRELFEAQRLDPDAFLPFKRLDPAFEVILSDGRTLTIPADEQGCVEAFSQIDPNDAQALQFFLAKVDRFAKLIGRSYCDRILETWPQVMLSPLMVSAAVISPNTTYVEEIKQWFKNPWIRELFYGFPTYSGFDPASAPASLVIMPWIILREGVWYPCQGGIAAIPRALAAACREVGIEIRTGVEVEAIERNALGNVTRVATSQGPIETEIVVSNADYIHTLRMLRGGPLSQEVQAMRSGRAEPSTSFFTVQLACDRVWPHLSHHLLTLTPGSQQVYRQIYHEHRYPDDPPLYVNTTSVTDPGDAPPGGSNPFMVINIPPLKREGDPIEPEATREFQEAYADRAIKRLEDSGLEGLNASIRHRYITSASDWMSRFYAFRGSIYGLGPSHNILNGGFRPLPILKEVPGLYFVGGAVQPGPGMPMVVQSGKIVAARIAKDFPLRKATRSVSIRGFGR